MFRAYPLLAAALLVAAQLLGALPLPTASAAAPGSPLPLRSDGSTASRARGAIPGLIRETGGPCRTVYRIRGTDLCSHGPDVAPDGSAGHVQDHTHAHRGTAGESVAAAEPQARCDGDGVSGKRVEAIYARPVSGTDRYASLVPSIREWIGRMNAAVATSAAEVDGWRTLRWALDDTCRPSVARVFLSDNTIHDFGGMVAELRQLGFDRSDRKYHVWYDTSSSGICGIATVRVDDSPGPANLNENIAGYGRTDSGCWGGYTELHEVLHTLGAVQDSAPHSSARLGGRFHCTDENDVMCYPDAVGVQMSTPCPDRSDILLDCGHDDYFHPRPHPDSYLGTHYNTADSGWMVGVPDRCLAESLHPSTRSGDLRWDLVNPDDRAATTRVHLQRFELGGEDRLEVIDGGGRVVQTFRDSGEDVWTVEVDGRDVRLRLVTGADGGVTFGFCADAIETVDPVLYPRAPDGAYGEAMDGSSITLHWTDRSEEEDRFEIERADGEAFVTVGSTGPNAQSWLDEGLQEDTGYRYRVCAANEHGRDCTGEFWAATHPACQAETTHPYPALARLSWTLVNPVTVAASTEVYFRRLETQPGRDFVELRDESGDLIQRLDGTGRDVTSVPIPGRTVHVTFVSDGSVEGWGMCIAGLGTVRDVAPQWQQETPLAAAAAGAAPGGLIAIGRTRAVTVAVEGAPARVVARRTSNAGASWSPPVVLSGSGPAARVAGGLDIGGYGSAADVLWLEGSGCATGGTCAARYRNAADGRTWTDRRTLTSSDVKAAAVAVARGPAGRVVAAWARRSGSGTQLQHELFARVSVDGGRSFAAPVRVARWPAGVPAQFDVAVAAGVLHVTWAQGSEVWVRRSTDDGRSWRSPVRLSSNRVAAAGAPGIAASAGGVLVGYAVHASGAVRTVVRGSPDRGVTWAAYVTLARSGGSTPVLTRRNSTWWAAYSRCLTDGRAVLYERESGDGAFWYPPAIVAERPSPACSATGTDPASILQPLGVDVAESHLVAYRAGICRSGICTTTPFVRRGI